MPFTERDIQCFVSVGANVAPEENILAALGHLQKHIAVAASSTFFRTEPIGRKDQPPYINGVWLIATSRPPLDIKVNILQTTENALGRVRNLDKYAPRTMDLDLIFYGDHHIQSEAITLPHPDIARPFVSEPVRELLLEHQDLFTDEQLAFMHGQLPGTNEGQVCGESLMDFSATLRSQLKTHRT